MKQRFDEIPYRLETAEEVSLAMQTGLLGIARPVYRKMLFLSQNVRLEIPPVLRHARKVVTKDFFMVKKEKLREVHVEYDEIANLDLVDNFSLIEEAIPWITDVVRYETSPEGLSYFPAHVRQAFYPSDDFTLSRLMKAKLSFERFLRVEMLSYVTAKKTKELKTVDELKRLLVLEALDDRKNADVKAGLESPVGSPTFQNACAELLFVRLPQAIGRLSRIESRIQRQKLLSKMAKLHIPVRWRINLGQYFRRDVGPNDLIPLLTKLDGIVQRISLSDETKARLRDYMKSLIQNVERSRLIYRELFLKDELEHMQRLYVPKAMVTNKAISYRETVVKTYTKIATLHFYPTKDYLDLCKNMASDDCSDPYYLGEKQLLTPTFFNVRIFRREVWIGNIYMLDLTAENSILLLDRIQIPRYVDSDYIGFFQRLKEALEEMFAEVEYRYILMPPLAISNHETVQKAYNRIKDRFKKETLKLGVIGTPVHADSFESVEQGPSYYVLSEKSR